MRRSIIFSWLISGLISQRKERFLCHPCTSGCVWLRILRFKKWKMKLMNWIQNKNKNAFHFPVNLLLCICSGGLLYYVCSMFSKGGLLPGGERVCLLPGGVSQTLSSESVEKTSGRKLALALVLQIILGICVSFSPNYIAFAILRFLLGAANIAAFTTAFVLGIVEILAVLFCLSN